MIQCQYCDRTLSSDGSYRVHKHRFHSGLEYKPIEAMYEEVQQTVEEEIGLEEPDIITENIYTPLKMKHDGSKSKPQPDHPKSQEPEHHGRSFVERGKGDDNGLAIIGSLGVIAVVIILAQLSKKQ